MEEARATSILPGWSGLLGLELLQSWRGEQLGSQYNGQAQGKPPDLAATPVHMGSPGVSDPLSFFSFFSLSLIYLYHFPIFFKASPPLSSVAISVPEMGIVEFTLRVKT